MQKIVATLLVFLSLAASSNNKFSVEHKRAPNGFARIKVVNQTNEHLACYIAIDGRKTKFTLYGKRSSKWYQATDKRFDATSFSTWCDYIKYYPEYKKYANAF